MSTLRLALCQYPVTAPATLAAFAAKLDGFAHEAAQAGAQLLVLPEYAGMETALALGAAGDAARELRAVTAAADRLLGFAAESAARHNLWLLPGSLPHAAGARVVNRATLLGPDGARVTQEKTCMTRFEAEHWGVAPGAPHGVFGLPWGRTGIAICYDVEFPTLVRAQVAAGAWLILAPSCTDSLHGFNRVRLSARARALENQCFVAITPTVGLAPGLASVDENHGYAAVFGPVDRGFAADGVVARGTLDRPGLIFADLDADMLMAARRYGAVRNHADWPDAVPACGIRYPEKCP